jgi:hypothetical protein
VPTPQALTALIAQWGLDAVPQDEQEALGDDCLGAMLDRKVVVRVEADGKTTKLYTRVREALQTLVSGDADRNTLPRRFGAGSVPSFTQFSMVRPETPSTSAMSSLVRGLKAAAKFTVGLGNEGPLSRFELLAS